MPRKQATNKSVQVTQAAEVVIDTLKKSLQSNDQLNQKQKADKLKTILTDTALSINESLRCMRDGDCDNATLKRLILIAEITNKTYATFCKEASRGSTTQIAIVPTTYDKIKEKMTS